VSHVLIFEGQKITDQGHVVT